MVDLAALDDWWASWLSTSAADLRRGGVVVAEHVDHVGVLELAHGHGAVLYGPQRWLEIVRPAPAGPLDAVLASVLTSLGERVTQVLGPAWYGYASAGTLRGSPDEHVRRLRPSDASSIAALRSEVSREEWAESGMGGDSGFGWFDGDRLLAAAALGSWRGCPSVGVLTAPARRGEGLGRAVVCRAVADALKTAAVVQYRAWTRNAASIALARSVGFVGYGRAVVVDVVEA